MAQSSTGFTNMVMRVATVLGQVPNFVAIQTSSLEFHYGSSWFLSKLHSIDFLSGLDKDQSILIMVLAYYFLELG